MKLGQFSSEFAEQSRCELKELEYGPGLAVTYFENEQEDYKISYLVPNAQKNSAEPIKIRIYPGGKSQEIVPHDGEDFGFVLNGSADLIYGGEKHHLKRGDTFYVHCNKNYHIENNNKKECELIWISTPPFF